MLALTGAEALYADMWHFGRPAISRAWFSMVLPALTLCYFGQGALLLRNPVAIRNPFFIMAPEWGVSAFSGAGDNCYRDSGSSSDFRGLFGNQPSGATGFLAAYADFACLCHSKRPDLFAAGK